MSCELGDCGQRVGAHPGSVIEKLWHIVFVSIYVLCTPTFSRRHRIFFSVEGRPTVVILCPDTFCASCPWVLNVGNSDELRRPYGSYMQPALCKHFIRHPPPSSPSKQSRISPAHYGLAPTNAPSYRHHASSSYRAYLLAVRSLFYLPVGASVRLQPGRSWSNPGPVTVTLKRASCPPSSYSRRGRAFLRTPLQDCTDVCIYGPC